MLNQFSGFSTDSLDVVRDALFNEFGASRFDANIDPGEDVLLKANWVGTKDLKIITSFGSTLTDISYNGLSVVRQYFEIGDQGRLEFDLGHKSITLSDSIPSIVVPSLVSFRVKARPNHRLISLRVENEALKNLLRALLDDDVVSEISFGDTKGIDGPWYKNFRQAVIQFIADLDLMGPRGSETAREFFAQALMIKFLFCNSNAFTEKLRAKSFSPSIAQLQQIEEYLEANWCNPVDIQELSQIFKISVRSIFRYFKKFRGVSPFEYSKGVRLRKAREMLQTDYERRGVMEIAMKCGFHSVGHFSRDYRAAFFELPSDTHRRSCGKFNRR